MPDEENPQLSLDDLEAEARARRNDPQTSHDAARTVNLRKLQLRVLRLFRHEATMASRPSRGFTDEEMVDLILSMVGDNGPSPSGLRTARNALTKAGLIQSSGMIRQTKRGRDAEVYVLTDAGLAFEIPEDEMANAS